MLTNKYTLKFYSASIAGRSETILLKTRRSKGEMYKGDQFYGNE